MSGPAAVRLDGVVKRYGGTPVLDGLDLDVVPGELLVLVGQTGSGKSTVLRVVAGLEQPESGSVSVAGRDVTRLAPHRRDVAMVFQGLALYPHLTVRENLAFGPAVRRASRSEVRERVERTARALRLADLLDRRPDALSGGQQQRVALARALLREPAVLLLDEPLTGLDAPGRTEARAELVAVHRRLGTTVVHVTHDHVEAMTTGQRIAVLVAGRVRQVGPPQEVYDAPVDLDVARLLGSPPMNLVVGGGPLGGPVGTVVGVRPEDLHLDAEGGLPADVVLAEAAGSETLVHVDAAGERLVVRTGPRRGARPGDRVRLTVDPARRHVFDAASGRRQG